MQQVYLQVTLLDIRIYKRFRLSQIFAVQIALHLNISRDRDQYNVNKTVEGNVKLCSQTDGRR